jgi:hypothetical protein
MSVVLKQLVRHLWFFGCVMPCLVFLPAPSPALAQETTGVPGSPSATTTIKGEQIPSPPQKFGSKIDKITLTIDRPKLTPEDEKRLMEAQRNNKASE